MYEQSLYSIVEPVKKTTVTRLNKSKKWKYGYNKEQDIVVISKTGEIGDIYEIQNLKIALPKTPKNPHKFAEDKWQVTPQPKQLQKLRSYRMAKCTGSAGAPRRGSQRIWYYQSRFKRPSFASELLFTCVNVVFADVAIHTDEAS